MAALSLLRVGEDGRLLNTAFSQTTSFSRAAMTSLLQNCTKREDLHGARFVHSAIMEGKYDLGAKLGCHLINIHGSCLSHDAETVFHALCERSTDPWTSIISLHINHGHPERAIFLYGQMRLFTTSKPSAFTINAALNSCACVEALAEGRLIHYDMMERGLELDLWSGNTLIDMYCKCNSLKDAYKILEDMPARNVVSWNSLLSGYLHAEHKEDVAQILERMQQDGVEPSNVTLLYQLKLCASSKTLDEGKEIHHQVYVKGLEVDRFLGSAILNMYAKCKKLVDAYDVFCNLSVQNLVAWSAMIHGYAENGHGEDALKMFVKMRKTGIKPDEVTLVCVLKACASIQALEQGRLIHIDALKCNLASSVFMGSTLVFMYLRCGSIVDAHRVFDMLASKNVVSWSLIIEGYTEHGQAAEALKLFKDMYKAGVEPNKITFTSSIKACASVGATDQGKIMHGAVIEQALELDLGIGNILVDMYAKGGNLKDAARVFDTLNMHNVESWSALIAGYANYGNLRLANQHFQAMRKHGIEPDFIAFTSLLYACSHAGLLEEAHFHLKCMFEDHRITPSREHFACVVDTLGRAGLLGEAEIVVLEIPFLPDSVLWKTLLSCCMRHNDSKTGRRAFESLLNYGCKTAPGYVLMSNIVSVIDEDG